MINQKNCPVCQSENFNSFFEIKNMPILCNVLWSDKAESQNAPKADIQLSFCNNCGHIFNSAFNPQKMSYTQVYENSLHYSDNFQLYISELAQHLVDKYNLYDKDIIEIGCGQGDFLKLLCKIGNNRGVGFDKSFREDDNFVKDQQEGVTLIDDFYSEKYAGYNADFICCRHVLEHIDTPIDFLKTIFQTIDTKNKITIFFEVPNILFTLRDMAVWDIIYEHFSYFNAHSLSYLFNSNGFEVTKTTPVYGNQFLTLEANFESNKVREKVLPDVEAVAELKKYVSEFQTKYQKKEKEWQKTLHDIKQKNQKAVIWGAGSKGVTFLNALEEADVIKYAIDINPRKEGKFITGSGQEIVHPKFLSEYKPDVILIMNPIYKDEINNTVLEMGMNPQFIIA